MLKNNKISRLLSLILVFIMVLASVPAKEVRAAENGQDIFVITSFEQWDEWKMEKTSYPQGTKIEDMKFPAEWKVKGFYQTDTTGAIVEKVLEKLVWEGTLMETGDGREETEEKEKAIYSEKSLAGEYVFRIVLPENVKVAEEVVIPSQKISIVEEPKAEEPKAEEPKVEEPKAEEPKVEGPKAEEPKPEEPKVEEPKVEEPKVEEPKVEEPKAEEPKVEEPKPEEPKEEPKAAERVWRIEAKILEVTRGDQRILLGKRYQIYYEIYEGDKILERKPSVTYEVTEGLDVLEIKDENMVNPLKPGSFKIKVSCLKTPPDVTCAPIYLEGNVVPQNTDATIHWFRIGEWEGKIAEDSKGSTIVVDVPYGTDVTKLVPEFEIDEYATVNKEMLTEQDFTNPVIYTVTSEDGKNVNVYTVKVNVVCTHKWLTATCTTPETCEICKAVRGEALGHKWKEATCTEPKTCTVCKVTEGEALGHKWKEATCTEPETCTVCKITRGTALGHSWGDWKVVKKPTVKEGGLEERICSRCQSKETREIPRLNIIGKAENNYIAGIKNKGVYGIREVINIQAYGDGMNNEKPIANDIRYLPTGWKVTSYTAWDKAPYKVSFQIETEGNYQLEVYFQKQIYDGEKWVNQKETDVRTVKFSISADKIVPVKTGDENPIGILAVLLLLSATAMAVTIGWKLRRKVR